MVTQANINVSSTNGVPYCKTAPVGTTEADLGTPVTVTWFEAILASVVFTFTGTPTGPSYIVLQIDLGDSNWIDIAWLTTATTAGTLVFVLAAGSAGGAAAQQTRVVGTAPASSAFIQMPLGGRFRFVGKTGAANTLTATITYRTLPQR